MPGSSFFVSAERKRAPIPEARLVGRHFPYRETKKHPRRCWWCYHVEDKRHRTWFGCKECAVPLCTVPCFEYFHTQTLQEMKRRRKQVAPNATGSLERALGVADESDSVGKLDSEDEGADGAKDRDEADMVSPPLRQSDPHAAVGSSGSDDGHVHAGVHAQHLLDPAMQGDVSALAPPVIAVVQPAAVLGQHLAESDESTTGEEDGDTDPAAAEPLPALLRVAKRLDASDAPVDKERRAKKPRN